MDDVLGAILTNKWVGLALAGVGGWALTRASKKLPALMDWISARTIGLALNPNTKDPVERKLIQDLVIAAVKLAEYKIPDRGMGEKKRAFVIASLQRVMPKATAEGLARFIEIAVVAADEELKEIAERSIDQRKAMQAAKTG